MERICQCCNISKPDSDFRDTRKKCKSCDNKRRYIQKMERRKNDPEYDKLLKAYDVKRKRRKEKEIPIHGVIQNLRSQVRAITKKYGLSKQHRIWELLGTDEEGFIRHFESKFTEGMTWENKGEWEIDHIIPVSYEKTIEWVEKSFHISNLQPLWKEDNRKKSNKILWDIDLMN